MLKSQAKLKKTCYCQISTCLFRFLLTDKHIWSICTLLKSRCDPRGEIIPLLLPALHLSHLCAAVLPSLPLCSRWIDPHPRCIEYQCSLQHSADLWPPHEDAEFPPTSLRRANSVPSSTLPQPSSTFPRFLVRANAIPSRSGWWSAARGRGRGEPAMGNTCGGSGRELQHAGALKSGLSFNRKNRELNKRTAVFVLVQRGKQI